MNLLRDMSDYAGKYYSHDFIRKHILRQTDDQIREIDDAISSELDDPSTIEMIKQEVEVSTII